MNQNFTFLIYIFVRSFSLCCFLPINFRNSGLLQKGLIAIILSVISWLYVPIQTLNLSFLSLFLEFIFGSLLSIPYLLTIECTLLIADLLDISRGLNLSGVHDSLTLEPISNLGLFIRNTLIAILLTLNMASSGVELFVNSISVFPIGCLTINQILTSSPQIMSEILYYLSNTVCFFLMFSVMFIMIDWVLAVSSKLFPTFNPTQEGLVIKSIVLFFVFIILVNDEDFLSSLIFLVKPFSFIEETL